jgi:hypothetical protein
VELIFVPKVHTGVQMSFNGFDESLYPMNAPGLLDEVLEELQGPTAIYADGSKTESLVRFGVFLMTGIHTVYLHCGIFTAEMCAIHFACNLIESKLISACIIQVAGIADPFSNSQIP